MGDGVILIILCWIFLRSRIYKEIPTMPSCDWGGPCECINCREDAMRGKMCECGAKPVHA
mgnify:CR=1 FL=1